MEEQAKKPIIDELKSELEEMEAKLKKSGDEFKEYYKEKKKKVAEVIKKYTKEIEATGEEKYYDLKEKSSELLDLLESDYDLSYTDYENESHKISKAIEGFEKQTKEFISNMADKGKVTKEELEKDLNESLGKFKTELDIQKAHWKGTSERAMVEFEDWKENRLKDIEKLKGELDEKKEAVGAKVDSFTEELSESFDHLKKAFKKLW